MGQVMTMVRNYFASIRLPSSAPSSAAASAVDIGVSSRCRLSSKGDLPDKETRQRNHALTSMQKPPVLGSKTEFPGAQMKRLFEKDHVLLHISSFPPPIVLPSKTDRAHGPSKLKKPWPPCDTPEIPVEENQGSESRQAGPFLNNKPKVNPDDFQYVGKENESLVKQPGCIKGHQFIVERCRNCNIFVFDWCDTVTVIDCTGCAIFVGPCRGSIFLRHCVDCTVLAISQQFRTRDCRRISAYLCCATQPIIESTVGAKFACLQVSYMGLEDQMKSAGLSPFNNNWSQIHDFTPSSGEIMASHNFSVVGDRLATAKVGLNDPDSIGDLEPKANFDPSVSLIPFTLGVCDRTDVPPASTQHCLVMVFPDGSSISRATVFDRDVQCLSPSIMLINSGEMALTAADLRRVLRTNSYSENVLKDSVVTLHYGGPDAIAGCQNVAKRYNTARDSIYVSETEELAQSQIESLWNLADMKMN